MTNPNYFKNSKHTSSKTYHNYKKFIEQTEISKQSWIETEMEKGREIFTDLLSGGEVEELRAIVGESGEFKWVLFFSGSSDSELSI